MLSLNGGEAVSDGLGEDVCEELALARLPTLVLKSQNCNNDKERERRVKSVKLGFRLTPCDKHPLEITYLRPGTH